MKQFFLGIMSGTSLDGIDLALADFTNQAKLIHKAEYPYPEALKEKLLPLSQGVKISLEELGSIDHLLGQHYAAAVNRFLKEFEINKQDVAAIGCHGQTVFHQPNSPTPFTMQLGDPNIIAALTGITTVADFRRKDMAFGGQGAPLVPAFHQAVFTQKNQPCIVLNIGGIANISVLISDQDVLGFDTGPGNMLMDHWIQENLHQAYDKDGRWAQMGKVDPKLLRQMLSDQYFSLPAPKSTGREYFHANWLNKILSSFQPISPENVQATLLALTAHSIANEIKSFPEGEVLLCGGGAKNIALKNELKQLLPAWRICTTTERGIDSDALEAMAFAWLAYRTINRQPGNIPTVTGASRACSLGGIYYPI